MEIDIVCANIIQKDGKFLLVKETKEKVRGQYNLPAGRVDRPESLIETAKREAKEETGLEVEPQKLVSMGQKIDKSRDKINLMLSFKSEVTSGNIRTTEEHPEVNYFSWEEIEELERKGLLRDPLIKPTIKDYRNGRRIDLSLLKIFGAE